MRHRKCYWMIVAGLALTRLGFNAVAAAAARDELAVTVLLTSGLCACLLGVTGMLGMLDWIAPAGQD